MASWPQIARRIRVPLGFGFAVLYVWLAQPTSLSILAGGCLALPGLVMRGIASGHVTKNEQLTMSGPYAYVRNPLYLGSLVLAAGFAVAARSWVIAFETVYRRDGSTHVRGHDIRDPAWPLIELDASARHTDHVG